MPDHQNPSMEMPRYQCHKKVWALKIAKVDGSQMVHPTEKPYAPFRASDGWIERFHGTDEDPGYYVVYDDGYASWSPTKAFEDGYTKISGSLAGDRQEDIITNPQSWAAWKREADNWRRVAERLERQKAG